MNKGKPSGKYAEDKTDAGRKGDYKRGGWPEDASIQRVLHSRRNPSPPDSPDEGEGRGRNRKPGSPF